MSAIYPAAGSHFSQGRWATSIVISQGQRKTIPKESEGNPVNHRGVALVSWMKHVEAVSSHPAGRARKYDLGLTSNSGIQL